jgi:hypothetical protein
LVAEREVGSGQGDEGSYSPLPGTFWNSRAGVGELGRVAGDVGRYRHLLREPLGEVNLSWGSATLALSVTRLVGVG